MLHITGHRGSASQIRSELPPHTHQGDGKDKRLTRAGAGVEKRTLSCVAGENVKWCSHCGKRFLKEVEPRYRVTRQFHLWVHMQENENLRQHRNVDRDARSSTLHGSRNPPTAKRRNELYPHEGMIWPQKGTER